LTADDLVRTIFGSFSSGDFQAEASQPSAL